MRRHLLKYQTQWKAIATKSALLLASSLFLTSSAIEAESHWAYQRIVRPTLPKPTNSDGVRNPIDLFVRSKQEKLGTTPNPQADRQTLIRRVYFDLIGLPPEPEIVSAFLKDSRPDAYERLIEQLLSNPHYGERWGRHWLDLARYADSMGYRYDDNTPWAYTYRDFVIKAFNQNLPYDTFVKWQLAGDELAPSNLDALAATGFCAVGPRERTEGTATNRRQSRYDELDDIIGTTFESLLGLTLKCARCHDHKFDPLSQKEYYQTAKVFLSAERKQLPLRTPKEQSLFEDWRKSNTDAEENFQQWLRDHNDELTPVIDAQTLPLRHESADIEKEFLTQYPLNKPVEKKQLEQLVKVHGPAALSKKKAQRYKAILKELAKLPDNIVQDRHFMKDSLSETLFSEWAQLMENLERIENKKPSDPIRAHAYVDTTATAVPSPLLARGSVSSPGEEVPFGFVNVLSQTKHQAPDLPKGANKTYQRTAFAEWITDVDDGAGHLLARVVANRLWLYHFGEGLTRTPNDFGTQGVPPAIPELLDWLASELVANRWDLRKMHRLIMSSAVYRQSTDSDSERASIDPENHSWWRRRPTRLQSEVLRDSILAVSACLNDQMGGQGVLLPIPKEAIISRLGQGYPENIPDGPEIWRRSVYAFVKRTVPIPMMRVFDGPDGNESCGLRVETTVAPQALMLMNSDFIRSRSQDFANRIRNETGEGLEAQVEKAIHMAFSRPPTPDELKTGVIFIKTRASQENTNEADTLANFCQVLLGLNEFTYID